MFVGILCWLTIGKTLVSAHVDAGKNCNATARHKTPTKWNTFFSRFILLNNNKFDLLRDKINKKTFQHEDKRMTFTTHSCYKTMSAFHNNSFGNIHVVTSESYKKGIVLNKVSYPAVRRESKIERK